MAAYTPHQQRLVDIYAEHPLREATILARILRQRGTLDGITELDLAHDSLTEITDQNHPGGVPFVVQLAHQAGVGPDCRVLDIGAGLGGSARCLAEMCGCEVVGVELSPMRCADANRLTERVNLGNRVRCVSGDIFAVDLPRRHFDVVWGQGAWMHIAETSELLRLAADALVPGGRIAFEEAALVEGRGETRHPRSLEQLEHLWAGRHLPRQTWHDELAAAGFGGCRTEDLTPAFVEYFTRLAKIARAGAEYPAHEADAFPLAIELARAGVIGYFRFVATYNGAMPAAIARG